FWETNIIEGVEPPIDGSKAASDFLNERYSEEGKEEVRLPESFDELIRYRDEMKESEKIIKEEIAQLENRIKSEMGKRDAVIGITPKYVVTWKSVSSNRLNKKLLTEKYPEAANDPGIYQISNSKRMTIKE